MGGHNSKSLQGQQPIEVSHPMFENAKIFEQDGTIFMTISMGIEEKEYQKWKQVIDKAHVSPQYLLLPKNCQFGSKGFCGSAGTLHISYDLYPYILKEEIESRKRRKSRFQECELWFLLYVLIAAEQQMKELFDTKIGDIRPHNIFVNEDGQIKISCLNSWPREKTGFQKAYEHNDAYLSPEEMNKLELGGSDDLKNWQSEMFSIGMTILSAAILNDFCDVYDASKMTFQYQRAQKFLQQWKNNKNYSEILTAVVCNLCSFSPQKRLTEKEFWIWIRQYETDIKNKEDFVIKKVPIKVQTEVQQMRTSSRSSRTNTFSNNKLSNQTQKFYKNPPMMVYQSQTLPAQRVTSPLPIFHQQRAASPVFMNGSRNVVMMSSRQSIPYSNVNQTGFVHHRVIRPSDGIYRNEMQIKIEPKVTDSKPDLASNGVSAINKEIKSQQVQTFFSPPESVVSQKGFDPSNSGDFVYTRRIINPTTNSLLGEESINQEQYHKGIIEKNLQIIQENNSVAFRESQQSFAI